MKIVLLFLFILASTNSILNFGDESPYFESGSGENMQEVNDYISSIGNKLFKDIENKSKSVNDQIAIKNLGPGFMKLTRSTNSVFGKSGDLGLFQRGNKINIDANSKNESLRTENIVSQNKETILDQKTRETDGTYIPANLN